MSFVCKNLLQYPSLVNMGDLICCLQAASQLWASASRGHWAVTARSLALYGQPSRGYGRVGREVARVLESEGTPFVIVDLDQEALAKAADDGYLYLQGNARLAPSGGRLYRHRNAQP